MTQRSRSIRIFVRKGFTLSRTDVRSFGSTRLDRGVEVDVPLSNVDSEFERWKHYVDKMLTKDLEEERVKLNHHSQPGKDSEAAQDTVVQGQGNGSTSPTLSDPYVALPWWKAPRDTRLAMIRVTPQFSELAKELHQKLKAAKNKTFRNGNATYKLWLTSDGVEFLQRWSKSSEGHGETS